MKLSFRLLLALPLFISAALVSSCTEAGFTAPNRQGPMGGGGTGPQVNIQHGETQN